MDRNSMSIMRKIIAATALAAVVVGGSLVTIYWQTKNVNDYGNVQLLDTAVSIQAVMQSQRQHGQEWETATMARDPGFVNYIAQALAAGAAVGAHIDSASIRDQLDERRTESYLTMVSLLDPSGHTLVASGNVDLEQRDYSATPLIKDVLAKHNQSTALWAEKQKLLLVTVAPVMRGTEIQALLMSQEPVSKTFLDALSKTSHADAAVIIRDGETLRLVLSTLNSQDAQQLQGAIATAPSLLLQSMASPANGAALLSLDFGDHTVAARAAALFNNPNMAMVIALVPADRISAINVALRLPIICVGIAMLVLLLLLGVLVWLSSMRPLAKLAKLTERAAFGDHEMLPPQRNPHFARISSSVNHLIKEILGRQGKTDGR
jgi:hypothetical protein